MFYNFRAYFTLASYITSISIITEKLDGTWNRTLVAGAKPYHFVLSHLIEGSIIMFIQFLEYVCYLLIFLSTNLTWNSGIILSIILLLIGMSGLVFGLLLSIVTHSVMASLMISQIFVYPVSFISGEFSKLFIRN